MLTFLRLLLGLVLLGIVVALAMIFVPHRPTPPLTTLPADYEVPSGAGEYAMYLGDCAACHTAEGGERFAGGRPKTVRSARSTRRTSRPTPKPVLGAIRSISSARRSTTASARMARISIRRCRMRTTAS